MNTYLNNYPNNGQNNSLLSPAQQQALRVFVANPTEETWRTVIGSEAPDGEFVRFVILPELIEYNDMRGFRFVMERYEIDPLNAGTKEADGDGENMWWELSQNLFDLVCKYNDEETFNYLLDLLDNQGLNIWQFYEPGDGIDVGDSYISECNGYLKNRRHRELQKLKLLTDKIPGDLVAFEIAKYTPLELTRNEANYITGFNQPPRSPTVVPPMPPSDEEYYAELREPFLNQIQVNSRNITTHLRNKRIIKKLDIHISYAEDHSHPDYEAYITVVLEGMPSYGGGARVNRIVFKNQNNILIGLNNEYATIYQYQGRVYYKKPYNRYGSNETYKFPRYVTLEDLWKAIEPHLVIESKTVVEMLGSMYDRYYLKVRGLELNDSYTFTVFDLQPVMNYIRAEEAFKNTSIPRNLVGLTIHGEPESVPFTTRKGIQRYHNQVRKRTTSKLRRTKHAEEQRKKAKEAQIIAKIKAQEKKKYTRRRK